MARVVGYMGPRCGTEDAGGRFEFGCLSVVGARGVEGVGVGVLWVSDAEVGDGALFFFWRGRFFVLVFVGGDTLVFVFVCRLEAGDGLVPDRV